MEINISCREKNIFLHEKNLKMARICSFLTLFLYADDDDKRA